MCHRPFLLLLLLSTCTASSSSWGVFAQNASPPPTPKPLPISAGSNPSSSSSSATARLLKGTLKYTTNAPNGIWMLSSSSVDEYGKEGIYLLPGQPIDTKSNVPIAPGYTISLICILMNPLANECSITLGAVITNAYSLEINTVNTTLRLLVVVVSLSASEECDNQPGANETDVRNAFLEPKGIADFFSECSFGRMVITREVLKVISMELPCSKLLMRRCEEWRMQFALSEAVQQRLLLQSGIKLAAFSQIAIIIPRNSISQCSWRGVAELPGTNTMFTPEPNGIFKKGTVMQELLHNFGMYHAYDKDGREYEDYSTAMGRGDSCPSAPELWRLGWAEPLVELNSTSLPAATFKTFNLKATYLGPEGAMIKIKPDWLGYIYTRNVYLALRVKAGGDRDLLDEFDGKLSIHEVRKDMDRRFTGGADPQISFIAAVSQRSFFTISAYRLQVNTGDLAVSNSSIVVKICRYINVPEECSGTSWSPVPSSPASVISIPPSPLLRPPPRLPTQPRPFPPPPPPLRSSPSPKSPPPLSPSKSTLTPPNPRPPSPPLPRPPLPSPVPPKPSPRNLSPPSLSPPRTRPNATPPKSLSPSAPPESTMKPNPPLPPQPNPPVVSPAGPLLQANESCGISSQNGTVNCQPGGQSPTLQPPPSPLSSFTPGVISSGWYYTCVLSTEGAMKCFGSNGDGQLGLGDIVFRGDRPGTMGPYLPMVDLGPNLNVAAMGTGGNHVCAIIKPGGIIKCWGNDRVGQLGLGDTNPRGDGPGEMGSNLPALDMGAGLTATAVAGGGYHNCALLQPGSVIKCWGWNNRGQLGLGDKARLGDQPREMGSNLTAVDLGSGLTATAITAGKYHNCALLQPGGVVKCWGGNPYGQLGTGDYTDRGSSQGQMGDNLPAVNLGPGYRATAIAAGADFTCALLQPGGAVKCWGKNNYGNLGQGSTITYPDPSTLPPIDLGRGYTATAIAPGYDHTCVLLHPGGIIKCWGYNREGQLGLGDIKSRGDQPNEMGDNLPPVDLGPGLTATSITASFVHTCALLQPRNIIKCWGYNFDGELGLEDISHRGDNPDEMGVNLPPVSLQ